jgi:8-oxo-dGTP pyrophosphatase MutT (NUDIX family)
MKTVRSHEVYRNPWMSVREDEIERADGSAGLYGVVDKPDFALVIPEDDHGFWLVEQYRYPVSRRAWEFPQGSWSPGSAGAAVDLARTELYEETGLRAGRIRRLGYLHGSYGLCSAGFDIYLATGLEAGPPNRESTEQDMVHRRFTEPEFVSMIRDGSVVDAGTVAAYGLLMLDRASIPDPNRVSG